MIKSDRSKRRKTRQEINLLEEIYCCNELVQNVSHGQTNMPMESRIVSKNTSAVVNTISLLPLISEVPVDKLPVIPPIKSFVTPSSILDSSLSSTHFSMNEFLTNWAVKYNISHSAVNGLLKGLKEHTCFNNLPVDSRTLFKIPSHISKEIRIVEPGLYHHFGLANGILKHAPTNINNIKVVIGIDGLPLTRSNNNQFWPILAYIIVDNRSTKDVFLVGLYYGKEKPNCSNDFLSDFVKEAKELTLNGIVISNISISISISVFACDCPAKAFILKVKGHNGFSSCTRCIIEGEYINKRVCFPYTHIKPTNRNHQDYINIIDEDYQVGNEISKLVELSNFDSVLSFSLDYMHLVCLGVMKKLLILWVSKGPLNVRVRSAKLNDLSKSLLHLNLYITSDFVRKNRVLQELSRWKATELRLFLLYTGPIVLKNIINQACYNNFMALNIAMIILLSPNFNNLIDYARKLLDFFVKSFQDIYGAHFLSHNVHGLLHLCDDYEQYGPLDNCSTFAFENYMKELKSFVRKHDKPLQQVINRYNEKFSANMINSNNFKTNNEQLILKPVLQHMHSNGPLLENVIGPQHYTLLYKNMKIKIQKEKDSFILTKNKEVVKCLNFCLRGEEVLILGCKFNIIKPFYEDPIDSRILYIYEVKNLSKTIQCWKIKDLEKKMIVFNYDNKYIAMPIIHSKL